MTEPDTETRDWEAVRAAAIEAVVTATAAANWPRSDAEEVADAVLAVCGEEAVNRMADQFVNESRLISIGAEDGAATLKAIPAREVVAQWVMASRGLLDGAENYVEISMDFPDRPRRTKYAFVLQKVGKLTPHEARKQAEARAEAAVKLLEEAFHLRVNGENAPGGSETWPKWDRKVETFLRELVPGDPGDS